MDKITLQVRIDRALVNLCAMRATLAGISTATWIERILASAIEAGTAGETVQQGSTEGESATRQGDAQPQVRS